MADRPCQSGPQEVDAAAGPLPKRFAKGSPEISPRGALGRVWVRPAGAAIQLAKTLIRMVIPKGFPCLRNDGVGVSFAYTPVGTPGAPAFTLQRH